ncbi:2-hydroxyacid dehydrogenase [Thelonectria olida]|uniref:2-hydroxyacid dehydrogenase n=1 Tax=Thelonectria olida TaxID=1576542 RepID=A0A9P9AGM1_9HYPO|nr:2-hydroxyacid dehydrogenase [Thelonectria olida]
MYEEQQKAALWRMRPETAVKDLQTCRMGILGYGAIGRQCAHLAQAFGVEVYAYTKNPRLTTESRIHAGYCMQGTGDVNGLIPAKCTHHLISHKQFKIMSAKKTFLINVARGPIIDTDALIEALNQGLLSGAALDVTDPEPLPDSHPLWGAPNVMITPHISWQSAALPQRALDLLFQNLERLDKGGPLLNTTPKMV